MTAGANADAISQAARKAADHVMEPRLWRRLEEMAQFGAREDGGVNRPAFSDVEGQSRAKLVEWAEALGFEVYIDPVTNIFIRRPGTDPDAPPVISGSHLDSQPMGGRFDGPSGVLGALEAMEAIEKAGIQTRRPIECVSWVNEEGCWVVPGLTGSKAFVGAQTLEQAMQAADPDGVTVGERLEAMRAFTPTAKPRDFKIPATAYIECHIEQGPLLEAAGLPVGVVTGIQGTRYFRVEVQGEAAHAGTTPQAKRKDAFQAALRAVTALNDLMHDPEDVLRFTVGRFDVKPGAPNTIPDSVLFSIDFRHPDAETVRLRGDRVADIIADAVAPCVATVTETSLTEPTRFPDNMRRLAHRAIDALDLKTMELPSGAGHDAKYLADHCPTVMLFTPCENGISHNPREYAAPRDLADTTRVLAHMMVELAMREDPFA